jgi:hypothetical protein
MTKHIVTETDLVTEYDDGTEAVRFTEAEYAAMAADPVRFGLVRPCGHPTGNGDCLVCEFAGYSEDREDYGCEGHPAGPGDPMGVTYCDGTCRP